MALAFANSNAFCAKLSSSETLDSREITYTTERRSKKRVRKATKARAPCVPAAVSTSPNAAACLLLVAACLPSVLTSLLICHLPPYMPPAWLPPFSCPSSLTWHRLSCHLPAFLPSHARPVSCHSYEMPPATRAQFGGGYQSQGQVQVGMIVGYVSGFLFVMRKKVCVCLLLTWVS